MNTLHSTLSHFKITSLRYVHLSNNPQTTLKPPPQPPPQTPTIKTHPNHPLKHPLQPPFQLPDHQLHEVLHRIPFLHDVRAQSLHTGQESFTPDGKPILGIVPEVGGGLMGVYGCLWGFMGNFWGFMRVLWWV